MVPGPIKEINACLLSARYRRTYFLLSCRHTNRVFAFREKSENPNDGQGPSRRRIRLYHPRSQGLRRFSGRREGYEDSWVRIVSRDITFSVRLPLHSLTLYPFLPILPRTPFISFFFLLSSSPSVSRRRRKGKKEDCKVGSRPREDCSPAVISAFQ